MDVNFINPFLHSITNILVTMATMDSQHGKISLKKDPLASGDVTGLISMTSTNLRGSLAVSFSREVALKMTSLMLNEEVTEFGETVRDMVGEVTNMVTGGAKKLLAEKGYDFDMATPIVIMGDNHKISHSSKGQIILIPFNTEHGEFYVEICFETNN